MSTGLLEAAGGLGIFLLGMKLMTMMLRDLAGERLAEWLQRFTRSPLSGAVTGTVATALIQSSSATTVAAVGFVSAGLMSFPQALGIIFGANIGTTVTGWLVALLGFKLSLASVAPLVVLVGVLIELVFGRKGRFGLALAGFALVFVGIGTMQAGLSGMQGLLSPADFPEDTFIGRIALVGLGALVTVITQSSSAGVATALTAVNAGAISFAQGAAVVIGMDVGTTATALLASVGATPAGRRTAVAHVTYNVGTGVTALLLLSPYMWVFGDTLNQNPEIGVVGFHSLFNLLGVIAILPFTRRLAELIERLWPLPVDVEPEPHS